MPWFWRLCAGFAVASALSFAQPPAPATIESLEEIPIPPRVGILGQTKISLSEAIERVLRNDRDLEISRLLRQEAGYNITAALGVYDPLLGMKAYRSRAVTPIASLIGGAPNGQLIQSEWNGAPQVSGVLPSGATYSMTFTNSRQITNSTFTTVNPQYPTSLRLDVTQPLWRGLKFDDNRYRLQAARKNDRLSAEQFRQRVIEVVTQATQAYWELVYASQAYDVQVEAIHLAEEQYASNRRQAEQGVLSPIDVVAAQTQVATFQQTLFQAQQILTQAENNLKSMMLPNRTDMLWDAALIPETQPVTQTELPEVKEAVRQALAARPEMSESSINLEINQLDQRRSVEAAKPQVNAFATLSTAGLAGIPLPPGSNPFGFPLGVPPGLTGSYGQSLANLWSGTFPTAQVGIQFSVPLRNRTAEAQMAVAAAEGHRLRAVQDQVAMAIESDVRNAMQAVASAHARLAAASVAARSAALQYASEQRQLQAGTSTVFLVLQRQSDLISARDREVRARADVAEAIANYQRATARTIDAHHILLQP